ncbi:MAG: glycosyltransferase family 39 protein [Verrucomicrobiota bacterium]
MSEFIRRKLSSFELAVAVVFSVAAMVLQWVSWQHVGPLWRDEICVVNIATLPTLGMVWEAMPHDHCPMLFLLLVRGWTAVGMGNSDLDLRVLGLVCGFVLLAALWLAGRKLGKRMPLISLSLAGLNFTVIRYGDSIRAYGLATALIILTLSLVWCCLEAPNRRRWLLAGVFAVLSVQTLYQNAFLLLAICLGGMAVCVRRRLWRRACGVLSLGLTAAVSLLPYAVPLRHAQSWWLLSKAGINFNGFLSRISEATGMLIGVWAVLILFAVLLGIGCVFIKTASDDKPERIDLLLFASLSLALGLFGFGFFIYLSGLPTEPWYYIPALVFAAVCCDAILPRIHPLARVWVLGIAVVCAVYAWVSAQPTLRMRQTNGDLAAALVASRAKPGDLIIVHPWYQGITFARHYQGTTPWTTLPPLADYRFHRYDQFKIQIQMVDPTRPVFQQIEAVLRSGNRVWVVGEISASRPSRAVSANLPPAPHGPQGWYDEPYTLAWGARLGSFLAFHAASCKAVEGLSANSVNPMESMKLVEASGWRISAGSP